MLTSPRPTQRTRGVVDLGEWSSDASTPACVACGAAFGVLTRRHHCRGCGKLFCSACTFQAPLEQYGYAGAPVLGCGQCAAPYVARVDPQDVPTGGGDLALHLYNVGGTGAGVVVTLDGASEPLPVKSRAPAGGGGCVVLTVAVPEGVGGGHALRVATQRGRGLASTWTLRYAPPLIARVTALPTAGGELILFGDNFGADADGVAVTVDGVPCTGVALKQPHRKLRATAPPGTGLANVRVEVGGLAHDVDILHAAPEVHSVDPPDCDLAGGRVVLHGANFGDDVDKIQVVLADHGVAASGLTIPPGHEHRRLAVTLPPMPATATLGEPVRLRVIVDGVHSAPASAASPAGAAASVLYCPPYGLPASPGRPAYRPRRPLPPGFNALSPAQPSQQPQLAPGTPSAAGSSADGSASASATTDGGAGAPVVAVLSSPRPPPASSMASPYAELFALPLPIEREYSQRALTTPPPAAAAAATGATAAGDAGAVRVGGGGGAIGDAPFASPALATFVSPLSSPPASQGGNSSDVAAPASGTSPRPVLKRQMSVRVGGNLASGPVLKVTPQREWAPDGTACELCASDFTVTRRRHHCRICGSCVCGACSPHQLKLNEGKPAVRVCERCHLRVGLLNQMAAAVDSIRTIGAVLPPSMSGYFRGEVLEAVMSTNEAAAAASSGSSGSAVGSSLASPFASPAGGGGGGAPATPARA